MASPPGGAGLRVGGGAYRRGRSDTCPAGETHRSRGLSPVDWIQSRDGSMFSIVGLIQEWTLEAPQRAIATVLAAFITWVIEWTLEAPQRSILLVLLPL